MFRYSLMVVTALILMLSLCTSLPASAGPYDSGQQQFQVAEHFAPRPPPRGKRVEPREARLNDRQAAERVGAWVVSDEIYDLFCYVDDYASPVEFTDRCIQLGGFSKSYGVPGWRMGYATGPAKVLDALKTLQQFSFVCPPAPFQYALLQTMQHIDLTPYREQYRHKRELLARELHPAYALSPSEGAFYAFPRLPRNAAGEQVSSDVFVEAAIADKLLIVPGKAFSARDTHFRVSFAASDEDLQKGIAVLNRLATKFA